MGDSSRRSGNPISQFTSVEAVRGPCLLPVPFFFPLFLHQLNLSMIPFPTLPVPTGYKFSLVDFIPEHSPFYLTS